MTTLKYNNQTSESFKGSIYIFMQEEKINSSSSSFFKNRKISWLKYFCSNRTDAMRFLNYNSEGVSFLWTRLKPWINFLFTRSRLIAPWTTNLPNILEKRENTISSLYNSRKSRPPPHRPRIISDLQYKYFERTNFISNAILERGENIILLDSVNFVCWCSGSFVFSV